MGNYNEAAFIGQSYKLCRKSSNWGSFKRVSGWNILPKDVLFFFIPVQSHPRRCCEQNVVNSSIFSMTSQCFQLSSHSSSLCCCPTQSQKVKFIVTFSPSEGLVFVLPGELRWYVSVKRNRSTFCMNNHPYRDWEAKVSVDLGQIRPHAAGFCVKHASVRCNDPSLRNTWHDEIHPGTCSHACTCKRKD